jgi:hypothetical protein
MATLQALQTDLRAQKKFIALTEAKQWLQDHEEYLGKIGLRDLTSVSLDSRINKILAVATLRLATARVQ